MPRPVRCRRIGQLPVYRSFSPDDTAATENVLMTVDEFEAFRLLDHEGLTQEACAARMNIARTTVTAIYESARKKVADALVNGKRLLISGGHFEYEPVEISQKLREKGTDTMSQFEIKCPHCGVVLSIQEEWIGMILECPECKQEFSVQESPDEV